MANEEKKLNPQQEQVNQQESAYHQLKRSLFGGMLREEGLTDEEIELTLKQKETAAHDDLKYTEDDMKEMESDEFKQWEAEKKMQEAIRKKKRGW